MSAENRRKHWKSQGLTCFQLSHLVKRTAFAGLLSAFLLSGCSFIAREQSSKASNEIVLLPWVKDGEYSFQRIGLDTLLNVTNLQGSAALFLLSPSVSAGKLVGFQPRVRTFVDAEGSHVPTDNLSIQLLSLYAHLEKLQDMDRSLGIEALLPKPCVVGVEVRIPSQENLRDQIRNNALYSPALDALLFVPFKGDELPLSVNAGVIAHEHFHAIFNYMVLQSVKERIKTSAAHVHPEDEKEMEKHFTDLEGKITVPEHQINESDEWERYHESLLRAMNEGLADVWGWVYSGDPVFVRRSLPVLETSRDLNLSGVKIKTKEVFFRSTGLSDGAYSLGTEYARVIKAIFEADLKKHELPRIDLAKIILKVLPRLEKRMSALQANQWMEPSELLEMFASSVGPDRKDLCLELLTYSDDINADEVKAKCGVEVIVTTTAASITEDEPPPVKEVIR